MTGLWKPGDVAWWNGERIFREGYNDRKPGERWMSATNGECWPEWPDDIRPLVVIDPEDREQVARLTEMFWVNGSDDADDPKAMAVALREFANPAPPKPEEPTGLGAVVLAHAGSGNREHIVRGGDSAERRPWVDQVGDWHSWADLREVEIVSEGVTL